ncbi:MAG: PilZ domain-containing protein [Gammaproteobacteria bacterium]|nr:PilZ domain-containing protein [Gammaproteobacteria bacterium]
MQSQPAQERRKHPRRDASLVVSYRPKDPSDGYDITQTQNVSQGGMLLTTARAFEPGVQLDIQMRLTAQRPPHLAEGIAEAVTSTELVRSLI